MGPRARRDASRAGGVAALIAFVDTNVLVRHLVGDPPEQARRATAALAHAEAQLVAAAEASGVGRVLSFDQALRRVGSIAWWEPGARRGA